MKILIQIGEWLLEFVSSWVMEGSFIFHAAEFVTFESVQYHVG